MKLILSLLLIKLFVGCFICFRQVLCFLLSFLLSVLSKKGGNETSLYRNSEINGKKGLLKYKAISSPL